MSENGPRMEVCPYCKKPFKRLKSHLPHCKMIRPDIAVGQVYQSKPATPPCAKKEKKPIKDLTRAKGRELETESEKRSTNLISVRPEWTAASFPPPAVGLERADAEIRVPSQLSFPTLKHSEPKSSPGEMTAPSGTLVPTSLKIELAKDWPKSKESRPVPSETEVSFVAGSVTPPLSKECTKHSSVLPGHAQAGSVTRTLITMGPQRQGLPAEFHDVPTGSYSPKNLSNGVQRVRASVSGKESNSRGGGHLPGVCTDPRNTETREKDLETLVLDFHNNPLGEMQTKNREKEFGLGVKACGSKEMAQQSAPPAEGRGRASVGHGWERFITEEESRDEDLLLNVFTPREATHSKLLSVSQPGHQRLASLPVKSLEEKTQVCGPHQGSAVTLSGKSKKQVSLEARSAYQPQALQMTCQPSSYSAQHLVSKVSLVSHVATNTKALPISVGLEWFPELYPGYIGLGVLPRTPQHWNPIAQMPQLGGSQGESFSQVPGLERSSANGRSLEPSTRLTTSAFPAMKLLGAVHKGWVRCSTTVKRSGVGAITMLFAGCFVLGCSWNFRHLKLQRWRK